MINLDLEGEQCLFCELLKNGGGGRLEAFSGFVRNHCKK